MNPTNATRMTGTDFLHLYELCLVACAVFAWLVRHLLAYPWHQGEGKRERLASDELACLSDGTTSLADAALAGLVHAGSMRVDTNSIRRLGPLPSKATAVHAIIDNAVDFTSVSLTQVRNAVDQSARGRQLVEDLRHRGLLMPAARGAFARWFPVTLTAATLFFGLQRLVSGIQLGNPVGYLVLLIFVQIFAIPLWLATAPFRTRRGDLVLDEHRTKYAAFEHVSPESLESMTPRDVQIAVALFGAAAMVGPLESLGVLTGNEHYIQWRGQHGCGGSGCGSSGGCSGGGGCGGGGCGGCGG